MRSQRFVAVAALAGLIAVSACSGSGADDSAVANRPGELPQSVSVTRSEQRVDTSSLIPAKNRDMPCELVTAQELSAILGISIASRPVEFSRGETCGFYTASGGTYHGNLQVLSQPLVGESLPETYENDLSIAKAGEKAATSMGMGEIAEVREIPSLGLRAYCTYGTVEVLANDAIISAVYLDPSDGVGDRCEDLRSIVEIAIARRR